MNAPLKFTSWLICSPCCCSNPSSTSSRTLPAWPKPPDPPGSLAPSSSAHRNSSSGDHAGADNCLPQANMAPTQTTFSRTAETKNLSMHGNRMLAPMGESRDPSLSKYGSLPVNPSRGGMGPGFRRDDGTAFKNDDAHAIAAG